MTELKMTHVLLLAVAAFLMYHFIGGCGNGFSLGGQVIKTEGTKSIIHIIRIPIVL